MEAIRNETMPLEDEWVYEHLSYSGKYTVYEAVKELSRDLNGARAEKVRHRACQGLTRQLRRILIHCCLDFVDADLYILDEFQRFRNLIDHESEEEQALIARRIFGNPQSRQDRPCGLRSMFRNTGYQAPKNSRGERWATQATPFSRTRQLKKGCVPRRPGLDRNNEQMGGADGILRGSSSSLLLFYGPTKSLSR